MNMFLNSVSDSLKGGDIYVLVAEERPEKRVPRKFCGNTNLFSNKF